MTETRPLSEEVPKAGTDQNLASNVAAGHLALVPTWLPLNVASGPGHTSAGSGGDGISEGVISSNALAVFMPSNAAIAGPHSSVDAVQGNNALINQHATEMAGIDQDRMRRYSAARSWVRPVAPRPVSSQGREK